MSSALIELEPTVAVDHVARVAGVAAQVVHERAAGPEPRITIAIPTFRRPQLLLEALRSVAAQGDRVPFEVVVVDNDPDGDAAPVIDALGKPPLAGLRCVRYVRNAENLGMFGNWNRCLALARTEWLTLLNDDDLLEPGYLDAIMSAVAADPSIQLIGCAARVLDERPADQGARTWRRWWRRRRPATPASGSVRPLTAADYFIGNPHHGSLGVAMRATLARAIGFDPALYPDADFVFLARYQHRHGAHWLDAPLAVYRIAVNESLKPAVVDGWAAHGPALRAALARHLPIDRGTAERYARLVAADAVLACRQYFGIRMAVDEVLERHRLPRFGVYWRTRWARLVIRRRLRAALQQQGRQT